MATVASTESATAAQTPNMPTIVLVQGSFQIPKVYAKLVRGLVAKGYPTIHPELPTCSNTDSINFPQLSLVDDALAIRTELTRQIEYEGKTVVLVMHSYGGLVGSEATTEELSYTKRQAQGLPGGVTHLFYYSAFLLNEGQSVLSAWGESPNNDVKVSTLGLFLLGSRNSWIYSPMAASISCTARKSSTAISHQMRPHCGPRFSSHNRIGCRLPSSRAPLGAIFRPPTSSARTTRLFPLSTRRCLQRAPKHRWNSTARDTRHTLASRRCLYKRFMRLARRRSQSEYK